MLDKTEKTLEKNYVYRGKIISVRKDKALLPNGRESTREVVEHPGGAGVIPVTQDGRVFLVRQFRYPFAEETLEIPAGKLDSSTEDPLACGKRELREEAGITARQYVSLGVMYTSPGYSAEKLHLYMARGLSFGEKEPDEDEFLDVVRMTLEEAAEKILTGEILDSKTQEAVLMARELIRREEKTAEAAPGTCGSPGAVPFYKMQGTGNDYVYIDCFQNPIDNAAALSVKVSDRHFGIGSDGLILLCPSEKADVKMQMYNRDGSEGKMCGNGIRCVGKLAYEKGICAKETMTVETLSGVKTLRLHVEDGSVTGVTVDMGAPILDAPEIPVARLKGRVVRYPLEVGGKRYPITCVSMGNPHAVIFTQGIDGLDLEKVGPLFENNELFPEQVNTEFVEVLGPRELRMRVWERGSGETMACGTGACAVAVAACLNGISPKGDEITVHLKGGDLRIRWDDTTVWMTGPAEVSFTGKI